MTRRGAGAALAAALALAYPVLVYLGLSRWDVRWVGLALAGVALATAAVRHARGKSALGALAVALLAGLTAGAGDPRFVLFVPVLINASLLIGFGATLGPGRTPMIERFARMQESSLTADQMSWCRRVTRVWCLFFVLNGATALILALVAPRGWWAAYTGGIAYLLIGALVAIEYVARKWRFQSFRPHLLDRALARLLPARGALERQP